MVATYVDAIAPVRPLREGEVQTHEGGIVFQADKWTRLNRFLILGTEGGSYYAGERELTLENIGVVRECLADDWTRAIHEIVLVSETGRAPKNDPAILALAIATTHDVEDARRLAYEQVARVCRTGTHILHFAAYRKALTGKGFGRGMRRAIGRWFTEKSPKDLAYQAVKYPSRDGWALADLLRMARPHVHDGNFDLVAHEILGKRDYTVAAPLGLSFDDELIAFLNAVAGCRLYTGETSVPGVAETIKRHRVPREVVATNYLNHAEVWDALLADMPMTAMIRNLGKMSNVGLLTVGSDAERKVVAELGDMERLRKARVHPIAILAALKVYEQGHGERGSLTWTPSKKVVNALDEAFYLAFGTIPPTRKRIRLAIDVSSSMDGSKVNGMPFLSAREAAAAMALVTANVEPDVHFVAYSDQLVGLTIRPSMRLDEVVRTMQRIPMGGTYCTLPILQALEAGASIDAFVSYTDSETWNGGWRGMWGRSDGFPSGMDMTADEALSAYRARTGINARHAVCAFAANQFSIANPADAGQMDFAGLDAAMPQLLSDFIGGVL